MCITPLQMLWHFQPRFPWLLNLETSLWTAWLCIFLLGCCSITVWAEQHWSALRREVSSPLILVTPNISRCRPSCMEKYKRQDDLVLWMTHFFLVGYGGGQMERLTLRVEKGDIKGILLVALFIDFWMTPVRIVSFLEGRMCIWVPLGAFSMACGSRWGKLSTFA